MIFISRVEKSCAISNSACTGLASHGWHGRQPRRTLASRPARTGCFRGGAPPTASQTGGHSSCGCLSPTRPSRQSSPRCLNAHAGRRSHFPPPGLDGQSRYEFSLANPAAVAYAWTADLKRSGGWSWVTAPRCLSRLGAIRPRMRRKPSSARSEPMRWQKARQSDLYLEHLLGARTMTPASRSCWTQAIQGPQRIGRQSSLDTTDPRWSSSAKFHLSHRMGGRPCDVRICLRRALRLFRWGSSSIRRSGRTVASGPFVHSGGDGDPGTPFQRLFA